VGCPRSGFARGPLASISVSAGREGRYDGAGSNARAGASYPRRPGGRAAAGRGRRVPMPARGLHTRDGATIAEAVTHGSGFQCPRGGFIPATSTRRRCATARNGFQCPRGGFIPATPCPDLGRGEHVGFQCPRGGFIPATGRCCGCCTPTPPRFQCPRGASYPRRDELATSSRNQRTVPMPAGGFIPATRRTPRRTNPRHTRDTDIAAEKRRNR
jgi:hypothetical protein